MPGPPPKPTALKIAAGNPGHRPLNLSEPKPTIGRPKMPSHLSEYARQEWRRVVPQLLEMGVLTVVDGPMLALYCEAYAEYVKATEEIQRDGLTFRTESGLIKQNPAVGIRREAMKGQD